MKKNPFSVRLSSHLGALGNESGKVFPHKIDFDVRRVEQII
ncbi:hypothetical protein GbCGDNIH2_1632 [Granulibacter bethesdensis]|uniref:Uncharacterized protein n=1 Tax=Granulibacter bethesdensis (strain ATCC BAA-1260 / CGDNIH1) TaxID=391165 RepID=Q0BRM2_GRABC|nr:hypothetical protein GbCGDNIH1_1632 [Granulibacter bethesdensis CGDNIH1]APG30706.1 hypothetical protein GbCGDNIH2_1632 [Granulibacter bethesdensis]APH52376.1 hypothetical protein GbCGDNIH5_1632 [Granulibacter bethesdensis]APH65066.1 hypothetical protein GbCGDNIH1I4_1632 [Granulibacter bethesdensis]